MSTLERPAMSPSGPDMARVNPPPQVPRPSPPPAPPRVGYVATARSPLDINLKITGLEPVKEMIADSADMLAVLGECVDSWLASDAASRLPIAMAKAKLLLERIITKQDAANP